MDLADIRKKAKRDRDDAGPVNRPAAAAGEDGSPGTAHGAPRDGMAPAPSRALAPDETGPGKASGSSRPQEATGPGMQAMVVEDDRLEQLFAFTGDEDFASEESYLQGLAPEAAGEEAEEQRCQWLTFSLGEEEYALDIGQIKEIIKPREVTEIPRVPDFILGVISLRGIIVPVYDLKRRLRLGSVELTPASRIVVCEDGERSAGLLVDSITQVVRLPAASVEPPPMVLTGLDRDLVEGVGRQQNRMLILLHLTGVLNPELV